MDEENKLPTLWVFVWVALFLLLMFLTAEVMTTHGFVIAADIWFENLLVSVRTPSLIYVCNWITLFGNAVVVVGVAGIALIFLWSSRATRAYAVGLAATLIGAAASDYIMKTIVERARPHGLIPNLIETSFSFPSGHATAAMALYGFLAYLLCTLFPAKTRIITTLAVVIIGSVGFSRLYLGLHFPSDVLAGYLLGGLWLLIGIEIVRRVRN